MSEPRWVEVDAPTVTLRALRWEPASDPDEAPIALCLHGFPEPYTALHRLWQEPANLPVLYMHGSDDGCMTAKLADRVGVVVPAGGAVRVVDHAGHFLQLEQPDTVAGHILDFIGTG